MDNEDELERQRTRAERVQSALAAVSAADLKTLLDDELGEVIESLARVAGEADAERKSRAG
jgi:hypothetical protein